MTRTLSTVVLMLFAASAAATAPDTDTVTPTPTVTPTSLVGCIDLGRNGTQVGTTNSQSIYLQRIHLPVAATLNAISALVPVGGGGIGHVGIFADNAGVPDALKADSAEVALSAGWNSIPLGPVSLPAGDYWLAKQGGDGSASYVAGTGDGYRVKPASYSSTFSANLGSSNSPAIDYEYNLYGSFCDAPFTPVTTPTVSPTRTPSPSTTTSSTRTSTPTLTQTFGCQNVNAKSSFAGSNNSAGMIHFQAFSVPANATLNAIGFFKPTSSVGLGHAALYADAGGTPGAILAESPEILMNGNTIVEFPLTYALTGGVAYWMAFESAAGGWFVYNSSYSGYFQINRSYASNMPSSGAGATLWGANYTTDMYALACNDAYSFTVTRTNSATVSPTNTASPTDTASPTSTDTPSPTITPTSLAGCLTLGNAFTGSPNQSSSQNVLVEKVILPAPALLNDITIRNGYYNVPGHVALYDDNAGSPGNLLVQSAVVNSMPSNSAIVFPMGSYALSPGTYWLAMQSYDYSSSGVSSGGFTIKGFGATYNSSFPSTAGGVGDMVYNATLDIHGSFCALPFTATPTFSNSPTVSPTPTITALVGCVRIGNSGALGATNSGGKVSYQKIQLPVAAYVTALRGLPNASSSGYYVRMAVYSDNAGQPGSLLVQGAEAGYNGQVEVPVSPTLLSAGAYWLAMQGEIGVSFAIASPARPLYIETVPYNNGLPATAAAAASGSGLELIMDANFCDQPYTPTPVNTDTPVPTNTNTPVPTNTPFGGLVSSGGRVAMLGPVPVKRGLPLCLALASAPESFTVDLYAADGSKVASLTGKQAAEACFDTHSLSAGLFYGHIKAKLLDGRTLDGNQKAIILP